MPDGSRRTALLVEDDPDDAALILLALERQGFPCPIALAEDGRQAIDYLFARGEHAGRDKADRPALVILDLRLPRADGLSVLKALRTDAGLRRTPVAVLTGSEDAQDRAATAAFGVDLYAGKPQGFLELCELAARLKALVAGPA